MTIKDVLLSSYVEAAYSQPIERNKWLRWLYPMLTRYTLIVKFDQFQNYGILTCVVDGNVVIRCSSQTANAEGSPFRNLSSAMVYVNNRQEGLKPIDLIQVRLRSGLKVLEPSGLGSSSVWAQVVDGDLMDHLADQL